jgi:hypothetical protein
MNIQWHEELLNRLRRHRMLEAIGEDAGLEQESSVFAEQSKASIGTARQDGRPRQRGEPSGDGALPGHARARADPANILWCEL